MIGEYAERIYEDLGRNGQLFVSDKILDNLIVSEGKVNLPYKGLKGMQGLERRLLLLLAIWGRFTGLKRNTFSPRVEKRGKR